MNELHTNLWLLKADDFAIVATDEKHQDRNTGTGLFKMIGGVPKEV